MQLQEGFIKSLLYIQTIVGINIIDRSVLLAGGSYMFLTTLVGQGWWHQGWEVLSGYREPHCYCFHQRMPRSQ